MITDIVITVIIVTLIDAYIDLLYGTDNGLVKAALYWGKLESTANYMFIDYKIMYFTRRKVLSQFSIINKIHYNTLLPKRSIHVISCTCCTMYNHCTLYYNVHITCTPVIKQKDKCCIYLYILILSLHYYLI